MSESSLNQPVDAAFAWEPRVLVVDDDPICRIAAKGLLERLGLAVDTAADGREAQELAAGWAYTAIFMDCYMPEIDGYEATREIRARMEPETAPPVIALTSHPRHVCLTAGLDYHIAKPLRTESLRDDCTSLGLLPWTGAAATDSGAPIRDGSPEQLPLLSGDAGATPPAGVAGATGDAGTAGPQAPAPAPEKILTFAQRATLRLPRLWRSANLRDLGSLADTAGELQHGAMGVGAARVAWLCDRMADATSHQRADLAASFEPLIRQAVNETAAAARALPATSGAPADGHAPTAAMTAPESWTPRSDTVRVAIADDDPLARMAIEAMLKRGDRLELVGTATDVPEIVLLVGAQRPDVAILDVVMPGGGGAEAARQIRQESPGTRVIALTAFDTPDAYLEMLRAGAAGLLVKGCTSDRLVQMVHQAAEGLAA